MGDWLRVPHSPHAGDTLSFHLPLHRAFARNIRSLCSIIVSEELRDSNPFWWLLPTIDCDQSLTGKTPSESLEHPLSVLLTPSLRKSNCRVTWTAGPECNSEEAQRRRSRARAVSAAITASKIIHSLCDHPLRCLAASEQISRHLWARNGGASAGMAINYSSPPLCQSFKDLDLTMVQLSASGLSIGLGARRVFSLLLSRFDLDGFLCDPEKKAGSRSTTDSNLSDQWVMPPILQDPDHAPSLADALFSTICVVVTELPPPPPLSNSDDTSMKMHVRRGLLHSLAVRPLSYSKAMEAASNAITRKDSIGGADTNEDGLTSFPTVFGQVLREISSQKILSKAAPSFEVNCEVSDEYDPTFFHLKRVDHQQAMDNIARLRKQKFSSKGKRDTKKCLPLVGAPPIAHPRFLPCRMLLHIPALDAAIRRALMFSCTGGEWLPPQPPSSVSDGYMLENASYSSEFAGEGNLVSTLKSSNGERKLRRLRSEKKVKSKKPTFSPEVVNNSSVSFLEVLQLLTLQVHTLEECASLHISHPNLDNETKSLSASMSINSYLGRLVHVPPSLVDAWAFQCSPDGPLSSKGSGLNRASILGLLIALYEHKSDNKALNNDDAGHGAEDGLGGARFLVSSGLKWLLRFVSALVQGASSVRVACQCALEGVPFDKDTSQSKIDTTWTIDNFFQSKIAGMLENLPDLWPSTDSNMQSSNEVATNGKNREAMKAAQMRVMERMKKQQASFVENLLTHEKVGITTKGDEETDLCIICRCDDDDGGNNGPMGFLGHVQRSRTSQLRSLNQNFSDVTLTYRVVGDMGCQIRSQESLDSSPVECIPVGSLVTVLKEKVAPNYGLKSRRVFLQYLSPIDGKASEGWASVQSSQGYTILSPLIDICHKNSRWGCTRPIIRQCGHAAHLGCVDAHVASIHQKAESETPFDGRFAAEIGDGEFLCPLCKQLSNIVVPVQDNDKVKGTTKISQSPIGNNIIDRFDVLKEVLGGKHIDMNIGEKRRSAVKQYGNYLYQAMEVTSWRKKKSSQKCWQPSLESWDFKEDQSVADADNLSIGDTLSLLRQQHIAWAAAGHGAAASEACTRGIRKSGFEPPTSDPWVDFNQGSRDTHPMLLELRRTLEAAASLYEVVSIEIIENLANKSEDENNFVPVIGGFLAQIVSGAFWTYMTDNNDNHWTALTALLASMPCHVSRDETLSSRHEARAVASQIWAIKSESMTQKNSASYSDDTIETNEGSKETVKKSKLPIPPTPMCIRNIPGYQEKLEISWGSMGPTEEAINGEIVFRPAFASGYLYMPLLSWDLNTFAGALFSTLLSSNNLEPHSFCDAACVLLVARLTQVLITPHGFNEIKDDISFECEMNIAKENDAMVSLLQHCNTLINPRWKPSKQVQDGVHNVLSSVSYAILPYARMLVLLLRAAFSVSREKGYQMNTAVESFIEDEDTMYIEDGFYFMEKLGCPLPSEIMNTDEISDGNGFWGDLMNKWINGVLSFDAYNGSRGNHLEFKMDQKNWVPVSPSINSNKKFKSEKVPAEEKKPFAKTQENNIQGITAHSEENNMDVTMDDFSTEESQGLHFNFDQVDNSLDMGVEFEDEVDMDESTDIMGGFVLPSLSVLSPHDNSGIIAGDGEDSVCCSGEGDDDTPPNDNIYANVSSAAIIPYQPSILGNKKPGCGPRGCQLDYVRASTIMSDLSHLGSIHSAGVDCSGLIHLPKSYVELYSLVNKVKAEVKNTPMEDSEDLGSGDSAICLMTGTILKAGLPRRYSRKYARPPGACTIHARKTGSGTGIFFLVQKCTVLLIHNKKSAYSASLYVDENGEEDTGLARGKPLYLKDDRYQALEHLWRSHGIPREVAQIRSTSDRVIRDNWY